MKFREYPKNVGGFRRHPLDAPIAENLEREFDYLTYEHERDHGKVGCVTAADLAAGKLQVRKLNLSKRVLTPSKSIW